MIESEKKKLLERNNEYLSIGITEGGKARGMISVPWEKTAHAHNMKLPDVYITPDDLNDDELLKTLHGYRVIGCYIHTPLDDYAFLGEFKEIRDLYIACAEGLTDISFINNLCECDMLYLEGASLKNLDPVVEMKKRAHGLFGGFRCVGLYSCKIEDVSNLFTVSFSEFLVWSKGEAERYKGVPAGTNRYYEI